MKGAKGDVSILMNDILIIHTDNTSPCPLHKGEKFYLPLSLTLHLRNVIHRLTDCFHQGRVVYHTQSCVVNHQEIHRCISIIRSQLHTLFRLVVHHLMHTFLFTLSLESCMLSRSIGIQISHIQSIYCINTICSSS